MKTSLKTIALFAVIASFNLTACDSAPKDKTTSAEENMEESQKKLDAAKANYEADVKAYKQEIADRIAANDKTVADFKNTIKSEKKSAQNELEKRIAALEEKNTQMKKTLEEYQSDRQDNWEAFKTEFNADMDELGEALKNLTVNNKN